ncbi:hypothetical protein [Leptothermofonsia sp. ETS-13]|uniref:hypothetical protein n=1 Tax=Leptothermofonsia sp. ETS-13 TaxID=3035696 RepID=UPI003BA2F738
MLNNTSMLRLVWTVVEETPSNKLLALSDTALVKLILQQISSQILLSGEEVCTLYSYIGSKISLIRDIAASRHIPNNCSIGRSLVTTKLCS